MIVTFAIANSDDKLSQAGWAAFISDVKEAVFQAVAGGARIQFAGFSAPNVAWQNALWVVELPDDADSVREGLRSRLAELCRDFRQNSIAWWQSEQAEMLTPAPAVTR